MTALDIFVLLLLGGAALIGFVRGFTHEVLALLAWGAGIAALKLLHTPLQARLVDPVGTEAGASALAFALLFLPAYIAVKLFAKAVGGKARRSVLGPVDRVLGFGFGAVKGVIIVVMAFSVVVLGYNSVWGSTGRPTWITTARTYPFVNASADAMVRLIDERQRRLQADDVKVAGDAAEAE